MNEFFDQEDPRSFIRAVPDPGDGRLPPDPVDEVLPEGPVDLDADPYRVPEVDDLLAEAIEELASARTAPMSVMAKVNRDELLDLLETVREQLPDELRRARWLLKERDEFLARAEHDRDAIIDQGRQEVARMVDRTEIVRAAEDKARVIVERARADARHLIRQTEDFCDQKLATFEVLLQRTGETVAQGRARLLGAAGAAAPPPPTGHVDPTAIDLRAPADDPTAVVEP